jgi:hypothetical protein
MIDFQEIHVILQVSCIGLFGTKWVFLHLENTDSQELFLSIPYSILVGKKGARCCILLKRYFYLKRQMSSTQWKMPSWSQRHLSAPWNTEVAGSFSLKTSSILSGKECARCSCIEQWRISSRDTCVSSPPLNRPIWSTRRLSPLWKLSFAGNFPFKTSHKSHMEKRC